MSAPKHTPGPWKIVPSGWMQGNEQLFHVKGPTRREQSLADADARLIAAAPELLEALELAREALTHDAPSACWATGPNTGDYIQDLLVCPGCEAVNTARAAIAKATGGAR